MAKFTKLKNVKLNGFFVLPTCDEVINLPFGQFHFHVKPSRVSALHHYDSCSRKYAYHHYLDVCRDCFAGGDTLVIVDFDF